MWASFKQFLGLKGDTREQLVDNYINRLNGKAKEDMVEVSTNLMRLQSEIRQFKDAIDKLAQQVPGQEKKI